MTKIIAALGRFESRQTRHDRPPEHLAFSAAGGAKNRLQLRETQLDRIEVGTVFRQKPGMRPGGQSRER